MSDKIDSSERQHWEEEIDKLKKQLEEVEEERNRYLEQLRVESTTAQRFGRAYGLMVQSAATIFADLSGPSNG